MISWMRAKSSDVDKQYSQYLLIYKYQLQQKKVQSDLNGGL